MENRKFSASIDVKKIDKSKLRKVNWTDKKGVDHESLYLDLVIIPLKGERFVKEGKAWKMFKTHFLKQRGDQDEEMPFAGDLFRFDAKEREEEVVETPITSGDDIDPNDIPF